MQQAIKELNQKIVDICKHNEATDKKIADMQSVIDKQNEQISDQQKQMAEQKEQIASLITRIEKLEKHVRRIPSPCGRVGISDSGVG